MRKAFVIGNVALDESFRVASLPDRGASVLASAAWSGLGGKGANQAVALGRAGVATTFVAVHGDDWAGRRIAATLAVEPLSLNLLSRPGIASDRSIVLTDPAGENAIVTTQAAALSLTVDEAEAALGDAVPGDALLLQGNLDIGVTEALAARGAARGLEVILNPSPMDLRLKAILPHLAALFLNEAEAAALTGHAGADAAAALAASGPCHVVLTQGAAGALLADGQTVQSVDAHPAEVVDPTGAGDCFEAVALASALLRGVSLDEIALDHGAQAAAMAVARTGAAEAAPSPEELAAILGPATSAAVGKREA